MNPLRVLTAESGFFTRSEAVRCGYSDKDIARSARTKAWVRFRHGAYAFADEWSSLDEVGRHRVRCNAVLRTHGDRVALSHVSGMICHGIEVWGVPLDRVHVTRLDGGPGRRDRDVIHHVGSIGPGDVVVVDGQLVLAPERCAIETASRVSNEVALCLFDAGLRHGAYDDQTLQERFLRMQHWPFVRHLHVPIRMADARTGSVGESRGNWWFRQLGMPAPEPQYEVRQGSRLVGVVDWWWPGRRLLGEFDGRVKYGRLLRPGQDASDVVFAEKRREDELREVTGASMIRLIWDDFRDPWQIRTRFDALSRRAG